MKILLTGGSGLLGKELQKYIKCYAPSHKEMDITKTKTLKGEYDLIIHCAAYTDVLKAEVEPNKCLETNVTGTLNLIQAFPDTPFVYISTEYAINPINFYSRTKRLGEEIVSFYDNYLIIRTVFKPKPFPWDKAFVDQYTEGDYVDVIAPLIAREIGEWDRITSTVSHVGTGRKTMLELAKRTKPNVQPISVNDIKNVKLPTDYL